MVNKNKLTRVAWIFIVVIIISQIVLRMYFWQNHVFFNGEQVRDSTVTMQAWHDKQPIYFGPLQANTGGLYLGPLYYYLLFIFSLPFNFAPMAGHFLVMLLWIIALITTFVFIYQAFKPSLAYIFCLILMISENFFLFTSYPLNINIIFIFIALYLIFLYQWIITEHIRYVYLFFIAMAFLLNCHLSALALWLMLLIVLAFYYKKISWHWLGGLGLVMLSYLPIFLYDFKNQFSQFTAWKNFLLHKNSYLTAIEAINTSTNPFMESLKTWITSSLFSHNYLSIYSTIWFDIAIIILIIGCIVGALAIIILAIKKKNLFLFLRSHPMFFILFIYTICIFIATAFIHTSLARHYVLIWFVPLLLFSQLLDFVFTKKIIGKITAVVIIIAFALMNISYAKIDLKKPGRYPLNAPFEGFDNVYNEENNLAKDIVELTKNKKGPFALKTNTSWREPSLTMKYLIDYHANFTFSWAKKTKVKKKNTILILYKQQLESYSADLTSKNFHVYILNNEQYKSVADALF